MSNYSTRIIWIALAALIGVVAGFVVESLKIVPTRQLKSIAFEIRDALHLSKKPDPVEILAKQYRIDNEKFHLDRDQDTALLPFDLTSFSPKGVVMGAGGITMVGDRLLIMGRLGNFFECTEDCAKISKVPLPPIPNNIAAYVSQPGAQLNEKIFRAHSVRFSAAMKMLAVSHEYYDSEAKLPRFAVSVISLDPATMEPGKSWETVFRSEPEVDGANDEAGGALLWGSDGKLFVTVGEFESRTRRLPQDVNSAFGKIFEIDVRAKTHRLYSSGLRNAEGLALSETLGLISVENGPEGGDQLNKIIDGANYGWPDVSLGTDYHRYSYNGRQDGSRLGDYPAPIYAWVPSVATSTLTELHGFDQRWDGDLLVGSLKGQRLFRLRLDKGRVIYAEPIFIGKRIRDLAVMKPGVIALWTDDGQVVLMSINHQKLASDHRYPASLTGPLLDQCLFCHHFGPTSETDFAPSFSGLLGRPIASDRFRYSEGLRKVHDVWTPENLHKFLSDPAGFASGTAMPQMQLRPDEIDEIVATFQRLDRAASAENMK